MRAILAVLTALFLVACAKEDPNKKYAQQLVADVVKETQGMTFHQKVDYVRMVVHFSTFHHGANDEQWAKSVNEALAWIYMGRYNLGPRANFRCSQRAHYLGAILSMGFGIKSRVSNLYTDYYPDLLGHTLLEVYNPERDHWEAVDPDVNMWWEDLAGNRLNMREVVLADHADVLPCSELGCGWDLVPSQEGVGAKLLRDENYLSVNQLFYEKVITINSNKFDVTKVFRDKGMTFTQWFAAQQIEIQ